MNLGVQKIMLTQDEILKLKQYADTYRSYSKPTDIQKLIVALNDIENKTDDDISKIRMCLKAERKAEKLHEEKEAIRKLIREEKDAERKKLEHKKFTLGGGLLKAVSAGASFNNVRYIDVLRDMFRQGFLTDKEKQLFSEFLQAPAPATSSPIAQNPQQNNPAVGAGSGFGFRG